MSRTAPRGRLPFGSCRTLLLEPLEQRQLLTLQGNVLFPTDNPWNQRVDNAAVLTNSSTLVDKIGSSLTVHADFGTEWEGAYIGIPFNIISGSPTPLDVVIDDWPDESDLIDVPVPPGAIIEGDPLPPSQNGGDRHLIVYDPPRNISYELYNASRPAENSDGKWHASAEAVWDMSRNSFRTPGDTSADAAGLPILPGLVRPDEVLDQGVINHALRFTIPRSRNEYVHPASHQAGVSDPTLPRMGERFRLKASFDISGFSAANQVILRALKQYGMIVADNGSAWYLSGSPSSRWNDSDLHELGDILGSNFEAVDLTPVVTSLGTTSGPAAGGTSVTISGKQFSGAAGQLQVFFGTTPAAAVNYVSDTQIVATAPAHVGGTVHVTVRSPYGTSATVSGDQFTFGAGTSVVGKYLFYNTSQFDGNNAAANAADDSAIASNKTAYAAGSGLIGFNSISSYSRGINGIMIDIAGTHGPLSTNDFKFKVGASNTPSEWATAPAPAQFTVRAAAGAGGSDRVEITWADGAIKNTYLEVIVEGNDALGGSNTNTQLAASHVFFFGNRVGDTGTSTPASVFQTNSLDGAQVAAANGAASIANVHDLNRSGQVNSVDSAIVNANNGTLARINIGSAGPFAPQGAAAADSEADDLSAIALALSVPHTTERAPLPLEQPRPSVTARPTAGATHAVTATNAIGEVLASTVAMGEQARDGDSLAWLAEMLDEILAEL